jgi:hypothetical protein
MPLAILKLSWRSFPKDTGTVCELCGSKNIQKGKHLLLDIFHKREHTRQEYRLKGKLRIGKGKVHIWVNAFCACP